MQNTKRLGTRQKKHCIGKAMLALGRVSLEADAQIYPLGGIAEGSVEMSCLTYSGKGRKIDVLKVKAEADAQICPFGGIAEGSAEISCLTLSEQEGKIDVLKVKAGGSVGAGLGGVKAKLECGVDLISADRTLGEGRSLNANLGLNVDTGVEYGVDGVSASVGGFGASIGRNTSVSMPFGSASLKWW